MFDALLDIARPALVPAFAVWGSPVTWLEIVAFAVALAMVYANFRVHVVAWPLAIASSLMYALLFADSRLYGEATLQFVFVAVAGWGWWQWLHGRGADGGALRVHRLRTRGRVAVVVLTLLAWPLLATLLARHTDSDVPWLDAFPTAGSLAGQFLLGRKLIENWPTWFVVNVASVGLFVHKGLWLTVLLYALFAVLSLVGWRAWRRIADRGG